MERSQLERVLSLLYRSEENCLECIEKLKDGRISPEGAAEEIFRGEVPEDRLICFFFLVTFGDKFTIELIEDLGKRGDGAVSVDEALRALRDDVEEMRDDFVKIKQKIPGKEDVS